jgi:hypothetical protein
MRRPALIALALAAPVALAILATDTTAPSPRSPRPSAATGGASGGDPSHGDPEAHTGATGRPRLLATPRPTGTPVSVTVTAGPAGPPVPSDFLGLSFEVSSLPRIAGYAADRSPAGASLVALLRSLGPGVMRFGGASADQQSAWVAPGAAAPRWAATAITATDLAGIAALARAAGWRVLLTVDLGHFDPAAAAQEAAAARSLLGSDLAGVELGNEPDAYVHKALRYSGWAFAAYRRQAAAYRAAIEAAAPGVPIAGPDPSSGVPGLAWVRATAAALHPALLTDHYYPLSSCGYRPTIAELLSPVTRAHERAMLARLAIIERAAATPLRLDETNNVSCEGQPGVSDTFAAALWALDYTARAIAAGIAGVNFHDLVDSRSSYSPLVATRTPGQTARTGAPGRTGTPGGTGTGQAIAPGRVGTEAGTGQAGTQSETLHANPEWYALLAARTLLGDRPLGVRVTGGTAGVGAAGTGPSGAGVAETAAGELTASALRAPDGGVQLVLVDYDPPGSRPLAVYLRLPGRFAGGSVLRLTAPSPSSTGGVRLGGRAVAPDGAWSPPTALPGVYRRPGTLAVQMPASSAAVVTLYPG